MRKNIKFYISPEGNESFINRNALASDSRLSIQIKLDFIWLLISENTLLANERGENSEHK